MSLNSVTDNPSLAGSHKDLCYKHANNSLLSIKECFIYSHLILIDS
jgi:hypothetical protein